MYPSPDLDEDANAGSENDGSYDLTPYLAALRSIGDTLFRIVPATVNAEIFIEAEGLLNHVVLVLDRILRESEDLSQEEGEQIQRFMDWIINHVQPPITVWSIYARCKARGEDMQYGPRQLQELYAMVKPIGTLLRKLPKKFP